MKAFCCYIKDKIQNEFQINVNVFVSRRMKHVPFAFERLLMSYPFYDELIKLVYEKWDQIRNFF